MSELIQYDRRPVERRKLVRTTAPKTFTIWILLLIGVAFALSLLK